MGYQMYYSPQALDDWEMLKRLGRPSLVARTRRLLKEISEDPSGQVPPAKKLKGEMSGLYARRLGLHHLLVYEVIDKMQAIKVVSISRRY